MAKLPSSKPTWNTAPVWAKYLAMDMDGTWYWFEKKPQCYLDAWHPATKSQFKVASSPGSWKKTLEKKEVAT